MLSPERLKELLDDFPDARSVEVRRDRGVIAKVVSGTFTNRDEAERQADVWRYLQERLPDSDMDQIEFIFTDAPGEE